MARSVNARRILSRLAPCLLAAALAPLYAAQPPCRPPRPLALTVQLSGNAPQPARLRAEGTGLVLENEQGDVLWSAGIGSASTQHIPGMTAPFGESLAVVDMDGDDLPERLYAGDRAGRLWRFTLQPGATAADLLRGGLLANLGLPLGGRGFIAPPELALVRIAGLVPWLDIALGSASTGATPVPNRFYLLRDGLDNALPVPPLDESRLLPLAGAADRLLPLSAPFPAHRGHYLPLGQSQVLAQALTLSGRVHFTVVENPEPLVIGCPQNHVPVPLQPLAVAILPPVNADPVGTGPANGNPGADGATPLAQRRVLSQPLPADAAITLRQGTGTGATEGLLTCQIGDEQLPGCALDTRPQRAGWYREDVD